MNYKFFNVCINFLAAIFAFHYVEALLQLHALIAGLHDKHTHHLSGY